MEHNINKKLEIYKKYKPKFYNKDKAYYSTRLLNKNEIQFYNRLINIFSPKYNIFPQVCLQSYIKTTQNETNEDLYKFPDFTICDHNFWPIAVIELNGYSHNNPYSQLRDMSVRAILQQGNIPLIQIPNNTSLTDNQIRDLIENQIKKYTIEENDE